MANTVTEHGQPDGTPLLGPTPIARLHLAFGFKSEGIRFLRRGLMIDPQNEAILKEMRSLGVRRKPVLGFLRRGHLFNRWFGRLRNRGLEVGMEGEAEAQSAWSAARPS